jgi:hypothetical protein
MDVIYEKPEITDFGSLERLTADCDSPGSGDIHNPGSLTHSTIEVDSTGVVCISK